MKLKKCAKICMGIAFVLCFMLLCCSCVDQNGKGDEPAADAVKEDDFSFELAESETTVKCGETVEYLMRLKNLTHSNHTLEHPLPFMSIYAYPDGEEDDNRSDIVYADCIPEDIEADGTIDMKQKVRFDEEGDYWLSGSCAFRVNEEEYYYKLEPLKIHVTDE